MLAAISLLVVLTVSILITRIATVILYGRDKALAALDQRTQEIGGHLAHLDAVAEQRRIERESEMAQEVREQQRGAMGEAAR